MARRDHYHVYVIELSKDVLCKRRFRKANPDYITGKPCVYVGMTGLDPDVRFDKHKAGIQSNRYVQEFCWKKSIVFYRSAHGCATSANVVRTACQ